MACGLLARPTQRFLPIGPGATGWRRVSDRPRASSAAHWATPMVISCSRWRPGYTSHHGFNSTNVGGLEEPAVGCDDVRHLPVLLVVEIMCCTKARSPLVFGGTPKRKRP
jgi:hypothetical protein